MRSFAVPLLLTALQAGISAQACADQWNKRWDVSGTPELRVDVSDGRIELYQTSGTQIEARVTTEGYKIAPAEVRVSERQTGNRVELEVRVPRHFFQFNLGNRRIEVEVRVPSNTNTELRTGDGRVRIGGVRGTVNASTGDGSVEASDFDGSLHVRTGDGHIRANGRFDHLDLDTGDGSIEASLIAGSGMSSGWRLHTGDGHVTIRIPQDLRATLDAHTGDGAVTVDVPITMEATSKHRNEMRGKLNGGGEILLIRTGDGSIRVEKI